jgi:hypothetical protein
MSDLLQSVRSFFKPHEPIQPGIYQYLSPQDDERNYRLHLRIEADGRGVLLVNASTVLHLNETASEYAYYFVQNKSPQQVAKLMSERYRVDPDTARRDYLNLTERVLTLIEMPDLDPVTFLDFEREAPFSGEISAPYRLDCALTYRLPENAPSEMAPTKRVDRELVTNEWIAIMDKVWQAGVPHVVFTGGEPTLRDDLVELLAHAESNGQVSGLLTDGERIADSDYLNGLLQTGLDHIMIVLDPALDNAWRGLENAIAGDVYTAVHLTITSDNSGDVRSVLDRLAQVGVHAISLSATSENLDENLKAATDRIAELDIPLVWDLPVPYSAHNPVALEVEQSEMPEKAGRAWLYVEPDGDVLPAQGINELVGNLLTESWDTVWERTRRKLTE